MATERKELLGGGIIRHLDGIRGIAILLVVVFHYFVLRTPAHPGSWLKAAQHVFVLAWSGVDLFFILSGFLIAGILLDHCRGPAVLRTFYIRRAGRILPLYLVIVGACFACKHLAYFQQRPLLDSFLHPDLPWWSYATFTQNLVMGARQSYGADWLIPAWSLGLEEQFYLVIPWIILFGRRSLLPVFLGCALILAPTLRLISPGFHASFNTLWRDDGLAAGALLAWLIRCPGWLESVNRHRRLLLALLGLLFVGMAVMTRWKDCFGFLGNTVIVAFYFTGILVTFLDGQTLARRILSWGPLVWFGRRSYGIYLIHTPIFDFLLGSIFVSRLLHWHPFVILMTSAVFGTLALAEISFRWLESPIVRWTKSFSYDSPRS